jgi:CARDB protein
MRRPSNALSGLNAAVTVRLARVGVLLLLATMVLGSPSAGALPIAHGSKCPSTWVNNPEAMACFAQGQEDVANGVRRPHYVACTAAGEIFCCVDTNTGQDCEAVQTSRPGRGPHLQDLQLSAILQAQQTILSKLAQIGGVLDDLVATMEEPNVCSAPDYVPLPRPGLVGPTAFCRLSGDLTKLQVLVYNQGAVDPLAKSTETRVTFTTGATSVQLPNPSAVNTLTLASGSSRLLEFPIPAACTSTTAGAYCDFTIAVDAGNAVGESSETNNTVAGTCFPSLF